MCGISLLIQLENGKNPCISNIIMMNDTIRHRGPDDEGYAFFFEADGFLDYVYGGPDTHQTIYDAHLPYTPHDCIGYEASELRPNIILAHRRLSIVDLSPAGHQPMCYENQRYWITYNGEIYNWIEIRKELEELGHQFVSHCDTEVILAAYAQWGKDCLNRFNGMWSFVIFDRQRGTLFGARDRFGIKPLYYWFSPEGFLAIASEIKQFTVLPGWTPVVNTERVYDFLVAGLLDHTEETMFSYVFQVRGGHAFEISIKEIGEKLPVYQWYQMENRKYHGRLNDAAQEFKRLLTDSVRLHLRADVPVGSCLSGGLDSSSIVCLVNDILKQDNKEEIQKTFSACSEIKKFDEREFIEEVVHAKNIESYYTYPNPDDLLKILDEILWYQDEPFGSTSIFAQWLVFELARKNHVKVMLDGQGADELLCGYHSFFSMRYAELLKSGRWITLSKEILGAKRIFGYSPLKSISEMGYFALPSNIRKKVQRIVLKNTFSPKWINTENFNIQKENPCLHHSEVNSVRKYSDLSLFYTSLPLLLHWEDRDSMAHSIESRVPFLDYRLVEFTSNLPEDYKIENNCTKVVLRKGMTGILPEKISARTDKMGFITAEEEWICREKNEEFRELVKDAIYQSKPLLNEEILTTFDKMTSGKEPFNSVIWRAICLGRWMERFKVTF
jgi:asparagine synthase (glutamine-hydrolysing)